MGRTKKGGERSFSPFFYFLLCRPGIDNEIFRIAETTCGNAFVLLVREGDAFACHLVNTIRHLVIPDAEQEFVGNGAGHCDHSHFAFPGFTDPATLGEFLNITDTLALGKTPGKCQPGVEYSDSQSARKNPANHNSQRIFFFSPNSFSILKSPVCK